MLWGREFRDIDESGDAVVDYVGTGVCDRRKQTFGSISTKPRTACDGRAIKMRAIVHLQRAGMTNEEIALAMGISRRHLRRKFNAIRTIAELNGRV